MGRQKGGGKNRRPSSSSLAASLLASSSPGAGASSVPGPSFVGFGGYVGSSRVDSSLPADATVPFADIDAEISQHLKRLGRKDHTTKVKALISLSMLLKEKSGKDIVLIIPQWAFEYKRLLLDFNWEVRRATHDTMTDLVNTVGRDLAPHLKSLMGAWWFSQFDPVFEVSQAAKQSLQAAFPAQEKRLDALILCTAEVFMYLEENLKPLRESMSDKAASDELKEMHLQVISSSLLALATLFDILLHNQSKAPAFENITIESKHAPKARETAVAFAEKLFTSHKYILDFLKSQSPVIRSASYSLLRSFIKNAPIVFNEGNIGTVAMAILGAFQEKDPSCHLSMWDAILLFSRRFPSSWTSVNLQKTVLNRFWHFLRSGCFGSQMVSYPRLILFLDTVPPTSIVGDKFFLEFFNNLWAGRNLSNPLNAEQQVFFLAFKECFLWGLQNAPRYYNGADAIQNFRVTLIENILVRVLWHDYLLSVNSKVPERLSSRKSSDLLEKGDEHLGKKTVGTPNAKYSEGYMQDLGKCIVEILSGVYSFEQHILSPFCVTFQDNCIEICKQTETTEKLSVNAEQIFDFLLLVDHHAVQKGETWPFVCLVGPMLAKSFQLIRLHDTSDAVKLLLVAVSMFGPRKVVEEICVHSKGDPSSFFDMSDKGLESLDKEHFMQLFKDIFVPWCLQGNYYSTSVRMDLLLELLDDECFSELWCIIISHAANVEIVGVGPAFLDSKHIDILAILIEKAREQLRKRNVEAGRNCQKGSRPEDWQNEFLDAAAVHVICSKSSIKCSGARFLWAVLGGSTEFNQTSFLSKNTMIYIFDKIIKILADFIIKSPLSWVRDSVNSLLSSKANSGMLESQSNADMLDMARFALDVLKGSFFCLDRLYQETELVSSIVASIFIIDWEYCMAPALCDMFDDELMGELQSRLDFGESVHDFHGLFSRNFCKDLDVTCREKVGHILIQFIRSIIFRVDKLNTDKFTSFCCLWVLEVLGCFCHDLIEEQKLLEQLLIKDDFWPSWIMPDCSSQKGVAALKVEKVSIDIHASANHRFVALIDKLVQKLSFDRVVAGSVICSPSSSEATDKLVGEHAYFSRPWLAAEILCTWQWEGGTALSSFLPSLSSYAKSGNISLNNSLLKSIVSNLVDVSLAYGASSEFSSLYLMNLWTASHDEIGGIKIPFLRALISILVTLFKHNIWEREEAALLFESFVDKIFVEEAIDRNCLRNLPPIMNVLIQPLRSKSFQSGGDAEPGSSVENLIHFTIQDWLRKSLSLPPLIEWKIGQDIEEWYQLVISCYPLGAPGEKQSLELKRHISSTEKRLLLELFRRQRHGTEASAAANWLPDAQMLQSKLMAVSVKYCCQEFNEEDWDFVLLQLRRWIELAVVIMDEVAETVNDAMTNTLASDNFEVTLNKSILIVESHRINIASNALFAFCDFVELQKLADADNLSLMKLERWDLIKNRIFEATLRLLFSTGVTESILCSCGYNASSIISSTRQNYPWFWESVASSVIDSSLLARDRAVKSFKFWGLSKGPVSSLYAILFSSEPISSLQFAAYVILSSEPLSSSAIIGEETECVLDSTSDLDSFNLDHSLKRDAHLREDISFMIEKLPCETVEMDLMALGRVNIFLAWSLLLSHISSLLPSSTERERLVQHIQESANSAILDLLFEHIPLELCSTNSLRKKDVELPAGLLEAARASTQAIQTGSLLSVESLWPIKPEKMTLLSAAIFGLMLRVLPAYVRGWFSDLRDHSASTMIESFTKACCSPPLIADELLQIRKAKFVDENFCISVSKSASEVVATYKKDETGMDLVIRLPTSYPLRPVDVDCTRSLGISEVKQRKWLMSMVSFVRNQNGALAEAIRIWKNNFDKEFEGVEECPICYSVIHTSNHSLPRLACKTCKHKFHSACLYKWFSTSHKSTCPLCQSPF